MNHTAALDITRALLEQMGISAEVSLESPSLPLQGECVCHIRIEEGSHLLIGQRGLNLEALQTIARLIVRKKCDGWANFSVDVNEYWHKKSEGLFREAREAEQKALAENLPVSLRPMSAFERKCVHLALADSTAVTTESTGSKERRQVVVTPSSVNRTSDRTSDE
ncbi:MAG: hypothetical protein IPL87_00445 [Candidatus Moraniibacteriota bacterium]|nr:MAG: hypothetical protein IPL87_00445 [Candidatus Moranbacteria bacterium]